LDRNHLYGPKTFNIAHCARQTYRSYGQIEAEVRKCRVLCPNCHRLRHHEERKANAAGVFYWTDYRVSELSAPQLALVDLMVVFAGAA